MTTFQPHTYQVEAAERVRAEAAAFDEARAELQREAIRTGADRRREIAELEASAADLRRRADSLEDTSDRRLLSARGAAELESVADDAELVRHKLAEVGRASLGRASRAVIAAGGARLADEAFERFVRDASRAARVDRVARELGEIEDRHRQTAAQVVHEPGPYGVESPHSWLMDLATTSGPGGGDPAAQERLLRHGRDVAEEVRKGSPYGREAERIVRARSRGATEEETRRKAEAELRTLTTGGGGSLASPGASYGGAFVPPSFLLDRWARYRSPFASFVSQLDDSVPLPEWGESVIIPQVTASTDVALQVEAGPVAETDPSTTYLSYPVGNFSGQLTVSQQLLDRIGPTVSADDVLWRQLNRQLAAAVDAAAINQALAGAQVVTNSGTFALTLSDGVGGLLGDIRSAKRLLTNTPGVRLRGTHLFAPDDLIDFIAAWADGQGRPIFSPSFDDNRLPIRSDGDGRAEGYSGYVLGGLALFGDSNMPESSGNAQILVCRPDTILQLQSPPTPYVLPQTGAGSLEATVGLRQYCATVPRYPAGVSVISGSAYASSQF
ncbi:phage major capsid protein [Conexibacter sp. DBS9H8]|uniref:phage major capsid protein n=1 Tax=Conexibacter sp. DBS9H8 TaxID=2937801 RepID=UPI00200BE085|nr:phage major capsid protein [Conexibacter sp. DBS9H8]